MLPTSRLVRALGQAPVLPYGLWQAPVVLLAGRLMLPMLITAVVVRAGLGVWTIVTQRQLHRFGGGRRVACTAKRRRRHATSSGSQRQRISTKSATTTDVWKIENWRMVVMGDAIEAPKATAVVEVDSAVTPTA